MRKIGIVAAFALMAVSGQAYSFGEMQSLPGSQIVAAGDISTFTCPPMGKYDCTQWPRSFYEMSSENICFTADVSCGYSCQGFIAQKNGSQMLYVLSGISRLESSDIKLFKCPSKY